MSIDVGAVLIFGLHYDLIPKDAPYLENDPEDYGLQYTSPYYDSCPNKWVYGITISEVDGSSISLSTGVIEKGVEAAREKFKELTGLDGKLYLSTHVM